MRYESEQDVSLRLRHSVVMYDSRPVIVLEALTKDSVRIHDILSERSQDVPVEALDLNPSHAPLGYVEVEGAVYLAVRKPVRRFKQGLTAENLVVKPVLSRRERVRDVSFQSRPIARTILGQYKSVGEAFQMVRSGASKIVPFHRDWAVADHDDELSLVYRGEVVGYVGDVSVTLLPERFYLKESLELCLK